MGFRRLATSTTSIGTGRYSVKRKRPPRCENFLGGGAVYLEHAVDGRFETAGESIDGTDEPIDPRRDVLDV